MTTVGYGDISAATIAERTMAIVGMIAANFVFSGVLKCAHYGLCTLVRMLQEACLCPSGPNHLILGIDMHMSQSQLSMDELGTLQASWAE